MTISLQRFGIALACAAVMAVPVRQAQAASRQAPQRPPASAQPDTPVSPAEVQRLFDAYALMQAEEQLKLSDEQLGPFMSRMKVLQEVRRRNRSDRLRLLGELSALLKADPIDKAQLTGKLAALRDLDAKAEAEIHKAYDSLDQVLDPKQQAQFRVLEESIERRKLELLTRARQGRRQPGQ